MGFSRKFSGITAAFLYASMFLGANTCGNNGCNLYMFLNATLAEEENRLVAGYGLYNEDLYPCRANVGGDLVPGKTNGKGGWVPYDGREQQLIAYDFDVLINPNKVTPKWQRRSDDGSVPHNAVPGGQTAEGEILYIGRCMLTIPSGQQLLTPGKRQVSISKNLLVPYGGRQYECPEFEYLVCE